MNIHRRGFSRGFTGNSFIADLVSRKYL